MRRALCAQPRAFPPHTVDYQPRFECQLTSRKVTLRPFLVTWPPHLGAYEADAARIPHAGRALRTVRPAARIPAFEGSWKFRGVGLECLGRDAGLEFKAWGTGFTVYE